MDLGASAIRETLHSSLRMGEDVLVALGIDASTARAHVERFRSHDERLLHSQYLLQDDEDALRQSAQEARPEVESPFQADRQGPAGPAKARRQPRSPPPP